MHPYLYKDFMLCCTYLSICFATLDNVVDVQEQLICYQDNESYFVPPSPYKKPKYGDEFYKRRFDDQNKEKGSERRVYTQNVILKNIFHYYLYNKEDFGTSHHIHVCEKICNHQNALLYELEGKPDHDHIEKTYNQILADFTTQILEISQKNITSHRYLKHIKETISLSNIREDDYDQNLINYGICALKGVKKHIDNQMQTSNYYYISPFAVGFLVNFKPIFDAKLICEQQNGKKISLRQILTYHFMYEYFFHANIAMKPEPYDIKKQVMGGRGCALEYKNGDNADMPHPYKVMLELYNIEILSYFLNPYVYKMLVTSTNATTEMLNQRKKENVSANLIGFYVVVFSLIFVDDEGAKNLLNKKFRDFPISQIYKKITDRLETISKLQAFIRSQHFVTYFLDILQNKVLPFLTEQHQSDKSKSSIAFLNKQYECFKKDFALIVSTGESGKKSANDKVSKFYKTFVSIMLDFA